MERDELDEKLNEEYSSSMKCFLRGSHHSKSTEMLTASKSRRRSSSGHFSAFVATEDSDGRTEASGESQLSHYYDMFEKVLDSANYDQESVLRAEEGNVSPEPEVSYYYKSLQGAKRDLNQRQRKKALEKYKFSGYQICSNNFEGECCQKDTVNDLLSQNSPIFMVFLLAWR